jgi:hypothetical protein
MGTWTELLARDDGPPVYVSGTVSNQGRFYDRFDAVVLLSAPTEVLLDRIESRTTNRYGKSPEQQELVLRHLAEVEPLLRSTCTHEIDAAKPLASVVEELANLGRDPSALANSTPSAMFLGLRKRSLMSRLVTAGFLKRAAITPRRHTAWNSIR